MDRYKPRAILRGFNPTSKSLCLYDAETALFYEYTVVSVKLTVKLLLAHVVVGDIMHPIDSQGEFLATDVGKYEDNSRFSNMLSRSTDVFIERPKLGGQTPKTACARCRKTEYDRMRIHLSAIL